MDNLKLCFAQNLILLRKHHGYTQLALAEKLNYSDKAVSKWERGEALPDVQTVGEIAHLFHLTIDELLYNTPEHITKISKQREKNPFQWKLSFLIVSTVWLLAIFLFVILNLLLEKQPLWLTFIAAVPASMIVFLVFAILTKRRLLILFFVALLTVSSSLLAFLTINHPNDWLLFLLVIPVLFVVGFALPYRK